MDSPPVCSTDALHPNRSLCSGTYKWLKKSRAGGVLFFFLPGARFLSVSPKKKTLLTSFVHTCTILSECLKEQPLREQHVQSPRPSLRWIAKVYWPPPDVGWIQLPGERPLLMPLAPLTAEPSVTQLQICQPHFILHFLTSAALKGKAGKVNNCSCPRSLRRVGTGEKKTRSGLCDATD